MPFSKRHALIALPLLVAACAPRTVATLADTPPPVPPRPVSPAAAYGAMVLPPRGADGAFMTPNKDLAANDAVWHLRAALNVAALRCTGADVAIVTASYNAMLKKQKTVIDKSYSAIRARYKKADAKTWQTRFDMDSTRLYNFFAQPAAKPEFCATAARVAAQVGDIAPPGFAAFAEITLAALDAPFVNFYEAYDSYRVAAADWDARYGGAQAAAPTDAARPTVTAALN